MKGWTLKDIEDLSKKKADAGKTLKIVKPKLSANALTKHAIKILTIKGWNVWRQNNGGVYDSKINAYRANSATKGISDILGYHRKTGRFIACEIKVGKDKLSHEQIDFLEGINKSGGIGIVVRGIEDLERLN